MAGRKESGALQTSIDIKHFPCPVGESWTFAVKGSKTENAIVTSNNVALNLIELL